MLSTQHIPLRTALILFIHHPTKSNERRVKKTKNNLGIVSSVFPPSIYSNALFSVLAVSTLPLGTSSITKSKPLSRHKETHGAVQEPVKTRYRLRSGQFSTKSQTMCPVRASKGHIPFTFRTGSHNYSRRRKICCENVCDASQIQDVTCLVQRQETLQAWLSLSLTLNTMSFISQQLQAERKQNAKE